MHCQECSQVGFESINDAWSGPSGAALLDSLALEVDDALDQITTPAAMPIAWDEDEEEEDDDDFLDDDDDLDLGDDEDEDFFDDDEDEDLEEEEEIEDDE